MSKKQRSVVIFTMIVVASVLVASCTQSLSDAPAEAPTAIPTGLFVSPIASVENPMAMIEEFAKQTAAAQTATAGGEALVTPQEAATDTTGTPDAGATATATLAASTPTNVGASTATNVVVSTPVPAGSRPPTYTLQKGEWPWCIARRYDVDPNQLLSLSGLTVAEAYSLVSGTVLTIPQSGSFPGERKLLAHPVTYSVSVDETLYSIACKFGDVTPEQIASASGITLGSTLTVGQQLQIP